MKDKYVVYSLNQLTSDQLNICSSGVIGIISINQKHQGSNKDLKFGKKFLKLIEAVTMSKAKFNHHSLFSYNDDFCKIDVTFPDGYVEVYTIQKIFQV